MAQSIALSLFDVPIRVQCTDDHMAHLIGHNFSAFMQAPNNAAVLRYQLGQSDTGLFLLREDAGPEYHWSDLTPGECLFLLEKDLTIELQKQRRELYFLHAAALRYNQHGLLLVGRSGGGKSTTCWGLLQHGCHYLSDELAPIDLQNLTIQPYPHALCLKTEPPAGYALPTTAVRTEATLHIPVTAMPNIPIMQPVTVSTVVFIEHVGPEHTATLSQISSAEASALLYAQALNPLCHPSDGLDAAMGIAAQCRCLRMTTGELRASIELLLSGLN